MSKLNRFVINFDDTYCRNGEVVNVFSGECKADIFSDEQGLIHLPQDDVSNASFNYKFEFYSSEKRLELRVCGHIIEAEREPEFIDKRDLIEAIKQSNFNDNGAIDAFKLIEILEVL